MNKNFSVRLDETDAELLEELAKREKRSTASMLRILFQEGLEARELVKESESVPRATA